MSLLWSGNNKKQFIEKKKPSPTYRNKCPDSARNPDSFPDGGMSLPSILSDFIKGTSLFASLCKGPDAGMTVEAAIVLPLFLFFFLNLGCAIEMIRLHGNLQLALWQIGSKLAVYGYAVSSGEKPEGEGEAGDWWKGVAGIAISSTYVRNQVIGSAGGDYLDRSPLTNGRTSLQFWESEIFGPEDEIELVVTYSVSPWSSLIGFPSFRMANRFYAHIWNGYGLSGGEASREQDIRIVYVTETGTVYHLSTDCTHLRLSTRLIPAGAVEQERNQNGGRYYPCARCTDGSRPAMFYITKEGDRYHYSRECSGLKRTVHSMDITLAAEKGYAPCSRCGE